MTAKIRQQVVRRGSTRFSSQAGSLTHSTVAVLFGVALLCTLSVIGFLYLEQVLATASQGTDMHDLENKIVDLKNQQKALELQGAQLRSLQTIETNVQQRNLVPTGPVSYLVPTPVKVATIAR